MAESEASMAAPLARLLWYAKREAVEIGRGEIAALLDSALLYLCHPGDDRNGMSRPGASDDPALSPQANVSRLPRSK
jgi:hypothetical protein